MNSKADGKTFQFFFWRRKNRAIRKGMQKFCNPKISLQKFRNPKSTLRKFRNPKSVLRKIRKPALPCEIRCKIWKTCANSFRKPTLPCENIAKFEGGCELSSWLKNLFLNLVNSNGLCAKCQRSVGKPKVTWTNLFKDLSLPNLPLFVSQAHLLLAKPYATLRISFLSIPRPATTHLKKRPPLLAPFRPWWSSEEAIPTLQYFARPGQESPLLRIHLKLRPFCPLRVGFPLALLRTNTRHGDYRLLHPLSHQYAAFHPREPGPQALERCLGIQNLILKPQPIFSVLPTLP